MAYQADIRVAVKGANQLNVFQQKLNAASKSINKVNQLLIGRKGKGGMFADYINGVKLAVRSTDSLNLNLSKAGRNFNKVALDTKQAFFAAKDYARAQDELNKGLADRNKLLNEAKRSLAFERFAKGDVSGRDQYSSPIGPRQKGGGMKGMMSGFSGTKAGQAVLGGGFPLLFGGGPGTVAGGAIGGYLGGFAGGIAGSLIGRTVDQAITGIGNLGKALNPLTADIDKLSQAMGIAGTIEGERLKLIEQFSGKQAALNVATKMLSKQIGEGGVTALKVFGERFQSISNSFSKIFTKLGSIFARLLNPIVGVVDSLLQLTDTVLGRITRFFNNIFNKGKDADMTISVSPTNSQQIDALFTGKFKSASEEVNFLKDSIRLGSEQAEIKKKVFEFSEKIKEVTKDLNTEEKLALFDNQQKLTNHLEEINLLKRQAELFENIRSTIANGMVNAVEALIDRTKSLNEVLASVVKQIGRAFLNAGINALVGNISFGGAPANNIQPLPKLNRITGNPGPRTAPIMPRAAGGYVTRPEVSLIGEAGENEYVIPASKMASSMQRYSAGARGDSVVAGGGSSYAGGGAGGSTTVNYSGPILNFNSEEFVPKSAVGQIIASASARGASIGENRTLSTLKNSRSRRSALGL